ncbi:hypothetical protein HMN09_00068700 [Mycena chlorophos]|uniref:Uncharacterized protein n=1 Tax=Mycena chlorophos TaxID=658473 RepID=A0A8H6WMJ9_MYCCL|nr:hypothetical protein HMN09_00068700 [Mycena chlorophos]
MRPNHVANLRLILLSLQAHLQLLLLVAAGWNVNASHGSAAPAAAVVLILMSVLFILLISIGGIVAFFKLPFAFLASIKFEFAWTVVLVVVELAATIGVTATGPPTGSAAAIVASHTLLIPAAWLATTISAIYAVGLFFVVRAHSVMLPEIWSTPAYSVDWFRHTEIDAEKGDDSWTRHLNDIEAEAQKKQPFDLALTIENAARAQAEAHAKFHEKAPWAQDIRRGVEQPFASRPDVPRSPTLSASSVVDPGPEVELPPLPLRVKAKTTVIGSRFIERFRDSWIPARTSPFPTAIADHDKPIPVSKDVKWVRADAQAQQQH